MTSTDSLSTPRSAPPTRRAARKWATTPGTLVQPRIPALLVVALLSIAVTHAGLAGETIHATAGISLLHPLEARLQTLYGDGAGYYVGVGHELPHGLALEGKVDWFQRTGHPASFLASRSESRLRIIPISFELQWRPRWAAADATAGSGPQLVPLLAVGPAVFLVAERLEYGVFDTANVVEGKRADWGAALGAGLELRWPRLALRLHGRALLGTGEREVLRPSGQAHERPETMRPSLASIALGVEVR